LGKSAAHARRYEQGTDIPLSVVSALSKETEIPMEWISTGRTMPRAGAATARDETAAYLAQSDFDVPVQKLTLKPAAGRGALMLDESAEHIRFPKMILQSSGIAPQNARLMEASGESMRTTINDGDLMLVDVSPAATEIVEGKIYVFAADEAYVKRLRRAGGVRW
jgi:phage repressor protein C with HTH and peptisase S24 domain